MPRRKLIFEWRDGKGADYHATYNALSDAAGVLSGPELDLVAAMHLSSGSTLEGVWECRWIPVGEAPEATPYGRIEDRLYLYGAAVNRRGIRVCIPSPISDIFEENTRDVNMAHPAVVSIVDASKLAIANAAGLAPVSFSRGRRDEISLDLLQED